MKLGSNAFRIVFAILSISTSSRAENILIIGDSLSVREGSGLGNQLDMQLRATGRHQVKTVAACGSRPGNYEVGANWQTSCGFLRREAEFTEPSESESKKRSKKTSWDTAQESYKQWTFFGNKPHSVPDFKSLLSFKQKKADIVVLQQGTNMYPFLQQNPPNVEGIKADVRSMLLTLQNQAPNAKCLWVAPPKIKRFNKIEVTENQKQRMFEIIRDTIKDYSKEIGLTKKQRCEILDSREFTDAPDQFDGTHFKSNNKNTRWVNAVRKKVDDLVAAPTPDFRVMNTEVKHGL